MDIVPGFTERQRQWFLRRDKNQCAFHFWVVGDWARCKNKDKLEVHHIIPRGWALLHLNDGFPVNGPMNGITLCQSHHNGFLAEGDYRFVVHPDTEKARLAYRTDKESYKKMAKAREVMNLAGTPYWNTNFDWMFQRWVKKHTLPHLNSGDSFPDNGRRERSGQLILA